MSKHYSSIIFLMLLTCMVAVCKAQSLSLPKIFQDHMVLQRDMPVRFWGHAIPGQEIKISIDGQTITGKTDVTGKWDISFPSHEKGGPYAVIVSTDEEIIFKDVYFGDVWIAGGQSNMEWKLSWGVNKWEEEVKDSDYPEIRFFEVPNLVSVKPQDDLTGGNWIIAGPNTSSEFSAVAWFFAKLNHLEKDVPVGIIDSNWGGTPAEAWTSLQKLTTIEGYKDAAIEMLNPTIDWQARLKENEKKDSLKWHLINDNETFLSYGVHTADYDDSAWEEISLPTTKALNDFVWVRKSFVMQNDAKSPRLFLGDLNQIAWIFLNGKLLAEEGWQDTTSVINIPPALLNEGKNTIAIRVLNSWDNQVWIGRGKDMWFENNGEKMMLDGPWKYSNTIEPEMPEVEFFTWKPGVLFNGMINPIIGYSIKGAIWYQGESNAGKAEYYEELFRGMITDWRSGWNQGDFPFLFVQLANFMERKEKPMESLWAELREAQAKTLSLPKTGIAVTIDIGDARDIHPRNKQDVGHRLWLSARSVAYDEEVVSSGPMYSSHIVKGEEMHINFSNAGSGLKSDRQSVKGFELAGNDGIFYKATAEIRENKIVVRHANIPEPKHVRYGWADNPEAGLYNMEGLPAVPFRTGK